MISFVRKGSIGLDVAWSIGLVVFGVLESPAVVVDLVQKGSQTVVKHTFSVKQQRGSKQGVKRPFLVKVVFYSVLLTNTRVYRSPLL